MSQTFVFWDIDGTLLTTGRAGIFAWERALAEEYRGELDFSQVRTAGLTDTEIALAIARRMDTAASVEDSLRILRRYETHLPGVMHMRKGQVFPEVVPILEALKLAEGVKCLLLTGNSRAGAAAKLGYYGIAHYFADGAFADGCLDRVEVAQCAARMMGEGAARAVVVGDTPNDVRCGKAIGARIIAVATGEYGVEELRAHGPDVVLERLPDPPGFLRLIGVHP